MSAQIVDTVTVYQGAQCKYYIVNGKKYHLRFPMEWAHTHKTFIINGGEYEHKSGPEDCGNCDLYGSNRGVFVGYCGNCLHNYIETNEPRGRLVAPSLSVDMLENDDIWLQYPYMYNVPKSEIGDEEGAEVTDDGINLERLAEAIRVSEVAEELDDEDRVSRQNAFCESIMDGFFEEEYEEVEEADDEDVVEDTLRTIHFEDIREKVGLVFLKALKV
jgi:hypothetical protein